MGFSSQKFTKIFVVLQQKYQLNARLRPSLDDIEALQTVGLGEISIELHVEDETRIVREKLEV